MTKLERKELLKIREIIRVEKSVTPDEESLIELKKGLEMCDKMLKNKLK